MAIPFGKTNFTAGELAPNLHGRWDLQKYQAGVKTARNFFVDYRGGASNRAGMGFVGIARSQAGKPRYIRFRFGNGQNYILVLDAAQGMQIIANGGLVTETPIAITAGTKSNPLTVTATGSWNTGDIVVTNNVTGLVRTNGVSGINGRRWAISNVGGGGVLSLLAQSGFSGQDSTTWTAYVSGGTIARILTVATPWLAQDLFDLKFTQSADVLTVTHPSYPTYDITRTSQTAWTVTPTRIGTSLAPPTSVAVNSVNNPGNGNPFNNSGLNNPSVPNPQFFYAYAVTAVNDDSGEESNIVGATATCVNSALNQTTGVVNKITWNAAPNATSYKIYKAQPVPNGAEDAGPYFYGLMGKSSSTSFADVNYIADFTTAPPTATSPFQSGPVSSVTQEAQGFGYISPVATVFDVTGSGAVLVPAKNAAGAITSTAVAVGGNTYSAPRVVFTEGDATAGTGLTLAFSGVWVASGGGFVPGPGSITINVAGTHFHVPSIEIVVNGATAGTFANGTAYCTTSGAVPNAVVIEVEPFVVSHSGVTLSFVIADTLPGVGVFASGASALPVLLNQNFPGVVAYFDQRRVFAGSDLNPDTFWMTRPGLYSNMDVSFPSQADDAITGTIVGQEVNQINSLTAMTSGLIALTISGAWQIAAAGSSAVSPQALTPSSATAGPQAFSGASGLQPLRIINDLLFESALGGAVRSLTYNFYLNIYTGIDISILSSHLLNGFQIVQWAYAEQPHYIVWAVRSDGIALSLTYLKEQELYGWGRHDTFGTFISVESIPEDNANTVYFVVQRPIAGVPTYTLERLDPRDFGGNTAANIASNPELARFLDCAVEYALTEPDDTLAIGAWQVPGQLDASSATIDAGGSGFSGLVPVTVTDLDGHGTGCDGYCTALNGVINNFVITAPGESYVNPQFVPLGGVGGALSARVINLMEFVPGSPATLAGMHVGDVFRVRGGKGIVHSFTSTSVLVDMKLPVTGLQMNATRANAMPVAAAGEWSCTTPVSIVGGLDHLTGEQVTVFVDGNVQGTQIVEDGCVTLTQPGTQILVGLAYTAQLGGLRWEGGDPTAQGRRKQEPAITLRMMDTRGVMIGATWDTLVEVKQRTKETYGQAIKLQEGGDFLNNPLASTGVP